ncbi:MAG: hypothetical protein RLY27_2232 [Pseudomonadota bacterium]|jgi:hypothetical protein
MKAELIGSLITGREITTVLPDSKSTNLHWVVRQSFSGWRRY